MRSTAILPAALELDPRVRKSRLEPRLRQLEPGGVVRGCLERFERLRGGAHPLLEKTQSRPENCGIEPREMVASLSRERVQLFERAPGLEQLALRDQCTQKDVRRIDLQREKVARAHRGQGFARQALGVSGSPF